MNHNDNKILSHSTWNCKYHIVFAPKYRRKIFYESHRREIIEIVKELCRWKEVEILEGEMAVDHVHLLLMIPPKMSVSGFMGYLKGKSSLMIYQRWGAAKYQYRCREFWCRGYYVDTVTYLYGQYLLMKHKDLPTKFLSIQGRGCALDFLRFFRTDIILYLYLSAGCMSCKIYLAKEGNL